MAKPFKNLLKKMSPEAQADVDARVKLSLLEMNLQELRQQFTALTQEDVADLLKVTQAYVSKVERRTGDMMLSTLHAYVKALGGEVSILVKLPGKPEVRIKQGEAVNLEALAR